MAKDNGDKVMVNKVAKVREVISNVSKNDIILALHSHDLDVARTIAALMEGGALDEWECAGGSAAKNKKKPAKKAAAEAPKPAPAAASVKSAPAPAVIPIAPSVPLASAAKKAPVANGSNGSAAKKVDVSSIEGALSRQSQLLAQWQKECAAGKQELLTTMKSLRNVVEEREKILVAELARQEAASSRLFANHKQTIETLRTKAASGADVSGELKAIAKQQDDLLASNVFSYDMRNVVDQISAFGRIFSTGVLPAAASSATPISPPPMKHSGSRSSLVSTVTDDSGLGQGSPVPPVPSAAPAAAPAAAAAPKAVSGGSGGPIQVASADGFSADQLAAIQKQVQERLAASGINTDVLMGVSGGAEVIRRPNKPKGPKGPEKRNGGADKKKNGSNLQLSIFE